MGKGDKYCEICGKHYISYHHKITRFCSTQCMWKDNDYRNKMIEAGKKQHREGTFKGNTFEKGHTINKKGVHFSPETEFKKGDKHPNWVGGTDKYRGSDWKEQRQKALDRDKNICQRCGSTEDLNVHHITPYRESKSNKLSNLITYCRRCHMIHEKGYSKLLIDGEDIAITHVPQRALIWFQDYSDGHFDGQRGQCLKHIIDTYRGMTPVGYDELQIQVTELQNELEIVKGLLNQPKDEQKYKTMADGTKRKVI